MLLVRSYGRAMAAALLVCLTAAPCVRAEECEADLSREARNQCEAGRRATSRAERKAHFERGQELGERAVQLNDGSADAHFGVFCNMGELMRLDGESITSVFQLHRLMAELDRALAIDPEYTDALAAKGTLLVRLPRLLGGDVEKGEAMLRRVIEKDPNAFTSRLALARTCEARGDRAEALAFATRALQIARDQGRADKVAEAQAALSELRTAR
jgi:tetratricopeptide (TPR) repeat protein